MDSPVFRRETVFLGAREELGVRSGFRIQNYELRIASREKPKAETPSFRTGFRSSRALLRQLLDHLVQRLVDNLLLRGDPGGEVPGSSGFSAVSEQAQNRRAERSRRAVSIFSWSRHSFLIRSLSSAAGWGGDPGFGCLPGIIIPYFPGKNNKNPRFGGRFFGNFPAGEPGDAKNGGRVGPPPLCYSISLSPARRSERRPPPCSRLPAGRQTRDLRVPSAFRPDSRMRGIL